jgi:transcriptional regulator with XRE-family HTH domain
MGLGQKIKKIRKEKGLTQADLCGDQITRNMLSQIESEKALPSISSLRYLARRLEIPIGYFLTDQGDELYYRKLASISSIKKSYTEKQWEKCIELCRSLPDLDDETALLCADCYLKIGLRQFQNGEMDPAKRSFELCRLFSTRTVYPHEELQELSGIYSSLIQSLEEHAQSANILAGGGKSFQEKYELAVYNYLLSVVDNSRYEIAAQIYDAINLKNPLYRTHISACLSSSAGNYQRAISLLQDLLSKMEKSKDYDPILFYRVIHNLETNFQTIGDYKSAFEFSERKKELNKKYKLTEW